MYKMKSWDIIKKLKDDGWILHHTKGGHHQFKHLTKQGKATVSHPKKAIPTPSDIDLHKTNPDFKNGVWALVEIDISKLSLKSKRINITMPERLIRVGDQYAKKSGSSWSGLLAQAVIEYMTAHQKFEKT